MFSPRVNVKKALQMFQNPTVSMRTSITPVPLFPSPIKVDPGQVLRETSPAPAEPERQQPSQSGVSQCI